MAKYFIAISGAILVFTGTWIVIGLLVAPFLPGMLRPTVSLGIITTNNLLGVIVGGLTASSSFRATLRHYRKKESQG